MKCESCSKKDGVLKYYRREICYDCWVKHCDNKINLKEVLDIGKEKQKKLAA